MSAGDVRKTQVEALRDYVRWAGSSAPGSRVLELDGVSAAIVPATPKRSIINSVAYDKPESLAAALPELTVAYEDAGIEAWLVWTPEIDAGVVDLLAGGGHRLDGAPLAMMLDLRSWEPRELGDLDWDDRASVEEVGGINDLAYGLEPPDGLTPAMRQPSPSIESRLYRARVDGEVVCVLGTIDHPSSVGVYFVGTKPAHRGKGLAARLMAAALIEARDRGASVSSLQASKLGFPVYERLGYAPHFGIHLYERKRESG